MLEGGLAESHEVDAERDEYEAEDSQCFEEALVRVAKEQEEGQAANVLQALLREEEARHATERIAASSYLQLRGRAVDRQPGDEQAAQMTTITEGMRGLFHCPASAFAAGPGVEHERLPELLSDVPPDLLTIILCQLNIRDPACLAATCRLLWCGALGGPIGLVVVELLRHATARGLYIGSSLPEAAPSWVTYLLQRVHDAPWRQAPLAVGDQHSVFVDREGRLLTCGYEQEGQLLLGQAAPQGVNPDANPTVLRADIRGDIRYPTPVPSVQDKRFVSVAASARHCLAISAEGEVYLWGKGGHGELGHAEEGARALPNRIDTLNHVESIAAGPGYTSAAIDRNGNLYTWGAALDRQAQETGLGYEVEPGTVTQPTPKRVDALSQDRVVGVALGFSFMLAVSDAGAVFSCGSGSRFDGSSASAVLPRKVLPLAHMGQRFVAVSAGYCHALALTEEGELYGWGHGFANGHGQGWESPQRVIALAGKRVKLVNAKDTFSCAVTENGELYTWGDSCHRYRIHLGHGDIPEQLTPKRVEALGRVKILAAVISSIHTLVADEDGVVWAFGALGSALGIGAADAPEGNQEQPTPIPNLRAWTQK